MSSTLARRLIHSKVISTSSRMLKERQGRRRGRIGKKQSIIRNVSRNTVITLLMIFLNNVYTKRIRALEQLVILSY
jgi:hypothetical protein